MKRHCNHSRSSQQHSARPEARGYMGQPANLDHKSEAACTGISIFGGSAVANIASSGSSIVESCAGTDIE